MGFMYPQKSVDRLKKRIDKLVLAFRLSLDAVQETALIRGEKSPEWIKAAKQIIEENENKP